MREISAGTKAQIWLMVRDMHILIGLILGCVLLYFWIAGNWLARAVIFPVIAFLIGFVAIGIASDHHASQGVFIILALIGTALAWPISNIPTLYWRQRMRTIAEAEMRSLRPAG